MNLWRVLSKSSDSSPIEQREFFKLLNIIDPTTCAKIYCVVQLKKIFYKLIY